MLVELELGGKFSPRCLLTSNGMRVLIAQIFLLSVMAVAAKNRKPNFVIFFGDGKGDGAHKPLNPP